MLILLEKNENEIGNVINYNNISHFELEKEDDDEHYYKIIAFENTTSGSVRNVLISKIYKHEYLDILNEISHKALSNELFIPKDKLGEIRQNTFSCQIYSLYKDILRYGGYESFLSFIKKAHDELLLELSPYQLYTNEEIFKCFDEKYGNFEEYKILKFIYNYHNKKELSCQSLYSYEQGYLGKYDDN